jgi:carbonic anhydrase
MTPEEALAALIAGNQRYAKDALLHPHREQERREASAAQQAPFAIVIGCSDSRVSPEILFDQGIGDIFVVRVAGNVVGPLELASVEYAALHLHSVVLLVLGHEACGAVNAVVTEDTADIAPLAQLIDPAVRAAKQRDPQHVLDTAVRLNALNMKAALLRSPAIQKQRAAGALAVEAAYYNLQTGLIERL